MSKSRRVLTAVFWTLLLVSCGLAQGVVASIEIVPGSPWTARVEGRFQSASNQRELRFLTTYGQLSELDGRISEIELHGSDGRTVASHKISAGRFIAESDFQVWSYKVDVTLRKGDFASAHVTWANSEGALIALRDLFPQDLGAARIAIKVPAGWDLIANIRLSTENSLDIDAVDTAVLHAGPSLRTRRIRLPGTEIEIITAGNWLFSDQEAAEMAESIFRSYSEIFGSVPTKTVQIAIRPFPTRLPHGHWEAGSRGSSITIMSSDMPFKSQSLQRLHEQLRHEIFHLWIPNAVNLTGNYDWFYEGFALYQSLKVGLAVNRLRFDDFLDTIARAYDIAASQDERISLIDQSRGRWSRSNTSVYAKGLLIAFASDLSMLGASKGDRSVSQVLKKVFGSHHRAAPTRANEAVLQIMREFKELRPLVDENVTGVSPVQWAELLQFSGLELQTKNKVTRIHVASKLSGRQKEVLDRLGYNNWQKLPRVDK